MHPDPLGELREGEMNGRERGEEKGRSVRGRGRECKGESRNRGRKKKNGRERGRNGMESGTKGDRPIVISKSRRICVWQTAWPIVYTYIHTPV